MNKIYIIIEGINFGGQQLFILNTAKHLIKHYPVEIIYFFDGKNEIKKEFEEYGIKVNKIQLHSRSKKILLINSIDTIKFTWKLIKYFKNSRGIIITNGIYSFIAGYILKKLYNKNLKHIRSVGGDVERNEKFYNDSVLSKIINLYSSCDKIWGWKSINHYIGEKYKVDDKISKKVNLLCHIDVDVFKRVSEAEEQKNKEAYNINGCYTIGWVGRIAEDIEIWNTLALCSRLKLKGNKFKLIICGEGPSMDRLNREITEYGLSEDVIKLGYVAQKELYKVYSIIDYEVLLDRDPMGGSHIREAMSCGRIVLTVNGPSGTQSEFIKDGVNGILVESDNYLEKAVEKIEYYEGNKKIKEKLKSNACNSMKKYGYYKIVLDMIEEIENEI